MEASASQTSSETPKRLIVKDPFGGKNRFRKEFVSVEAEDASPRSLDLDSKIWSGLPEEVLLQIFARLPVKDILRMRSLNHTWRSSITSPHFQAAFEAASLVRLALLVHDKVDGTMFLTQDDGQECFRSGIARSPEVVSNTHVAATANGLVCVIEHEKKVRTPGNPDMIEIRVFVMNVVTGFRRALPYPSDTPKLPSFVGMDFLPGGGYTISFLYAAKDGLSWEVYDSVEDRWSRTDDEGSMAHLNDKEMFIMHRVSSAFFYGNVIAFYIKAKCVKVFSLCAPHGDFCDDVYMAHSVHHVSGEVYMLGGLGGQNGVWRRDFRSSETWELVCECPVPEGTLTCLRVLNDVVVVVFKSYHRQPDAQLFGVVPGIDVGTVLKVFHMPTKSWHSFPEKDYVVQNWGESIRKNYAGPFLVEAKFDVVP